MPSVEKSTMFPCTIKMEKRKVRLEGIRRGIQTFPPPLYTVHYVYIKEMGNQKTINISCCCFLLFGMVTRVRRDKRQPMTLDFVFQICLICLFMHLHFRGRTISPEIEDQREKEKINFSSSFGFFRSMSFSRETMSRSIIHGWNVCAVPFESGSLAWQSVQSAVRERRHCRISESHSGRSGIDFGNVSLLLLLLHSSPPWLLRQPLHPFPHDPRLIHWNRWVVREGGSKIPQTTIVQFEPTPGRTLSPIGYIGRRFNPIISTKVC